MENIHFENQDPNSLLRKAQALGKDIKKIESIDLSDAYELTQKKIHSNHRVKFMGQIMRYAAFLTLPLLLSTIYLCYIHYVETPVTVRYAEVKAAAGSVIRYELPDNSIVWLNAGSTLRYPTTFDKNKRQVDLRGEAYFEVKADKKCPFYVNTPIGLKVYVYGTRFNVSAYDDDNFIETVLEKGKVNIIAPDQKTMYKLEPGECMYYDKKSHDFTKKQIDVYEMTAWKDGKLIFRNTPLEEVLRRLSRHFNVDIQLNNLSHHEYDYRATFRDETLPQILDYLSKSVTMRWKTVDSVQKDDDTFAKRKVIVYLY
jgi:transmembrane sensor